jgi:hypothetical protein
MYFDTKNYLKSNRNHTDKQTLMPLGSGAAEKDHIDAFDTKMSKAPARLFTQTKTIYKEPVVYHMAPFLLITTIFKQEERNSTRAINK